jgi:exonuclease III
MKWIFWNSNGLRDQAKFRFLFDSAKELQLDFIAILKTKMNDFTTAELNHFCANKNFSWNWSPTRGRAGGILLGINLEMFSVQNLVLDNFYVKIHLRNKMDSFEWGLVAVYGAAQNEEKNLFLQELVQASSGPSLPLLVGGDFNIIRNPRKKNNVRYDDRWAFLFNVVINSLDLREIALPERQFTWENNMPTPTFEKLDRILTSTDWELKYPRVTAHALPRILSDHTPLLLDTGIPSQTNL